MQHSTDRAPIADIAIRAERPGDEPAIANVTREAFRTHPHSRQTEHIIIDALRDSGALTISLVAEHAGGIVGHIAFSPVTISDGTPDWYILGPLSVTPALQRRGIGQALVRVGLERMRALGAAGCVLVGDPAYYGRFGFTNDPTLIYHGVPQEYVLALAFQPVDASGDIAHHPAFEAG